MKVSETMTFDEYWDDPRFQLKKPVMTGSRMMGYGDNIYHHGRDGDWVQADSHHSLDGGIANPKNLDDDTQTDRVLIVKNFWYFGSLAPRFRPSFAARDPLTFVLAGDTKSILLTGLSTNSWPGSTLSPRAAEGDPTVGRTDIGPSIGFRMAMTPVLACLRVW